MEKRKQLCIKLPMMEAEQLMKIARKNNVTITEQVRRYISKGMTVDAYQNDEERILVNMRASLKQILDPQIERIVKISVKNSVSSSINLLYTAFYMQRVVSAGNIQKLEAVMDEARRLGIGFVQQAKGSIDDFVRASIEKIEATWEDT